jgi:quinohemoprotein ethanol dehydrogenase
VIQKGQKLFGETCSRCHGENARGGVKDLRFMSPEAHAQFKAIVIDGIRKDKGMVGFADILEPEDAEAIHWYLIARANEDWKDETFAPPPAPKPPGD